MDTAMMNPADENQINIELVKAQDDDEIIITENFGLIESTNQENQLIIVEINNGIEQNYSTNSPNSNANTPNDRTVKIETLLNLLNHSYNCSQSNCTYDKCLKFKLMIEHTRKCQSKQNCENQCRKLIALIIYHAKNCTNDNCKIDFCRSIKFKLEKKTQEKKLELFKRFIRTSLNNLLNESIIENNKTSELISKLDQIFVNFTQKSSDELFIDKKIREELVKYAFQISCLEKMAKPYEYIYSDSSYASFVAFLIKKEIQLFNEYKNKPYLNYLEQFTNMVFTIYNEFDKYLNQEPKQAINCKKFKNKLNENNRQLSQNDDQDENSLDQELDIEYKPETKRLKLD